MFRSRWRYPVLLAVRSEPLEYWWPTTIMPSSWKYEFWIQSVVRLHVVNVLRDLPCPLVGESFIVWRIDISRYVPDNSEDGIWRQIWIDLPGSRAIENQRSLEPHRGRQRRINGSQIMARSYQCQIFVMNYALFVLDIEYVWWFVLDIEYVWWFHLGVWQSFWRLSRVWQKPIKVWSHNLLVSILQIIDHSSVRTKVAFYLRASVFPPIEGRVRLCSLAFEPSVLLRKISIIQKTLE